jgi:hypothetical protein
LKGGGNIYTSGRLACWRLPSAISDSTGKLEFALKANMSTSKTLHVLDKPTLEKGFNCSIS